MLIKLAPRWMPPASPTNFRDDVNVDGSITQTDVNITQGQVGTSIP